MPDSIDATRQRLLSERDQLLQRLGRLHAHQIREAQPLSADFAEQAVERANDEVVDQLDQSSAALLSSVDAALRRLDAGDYGICVGCAGAIEPERLRLMPDAPTCASCARAAEVRETAAGHARA